MNDNWEHKILSKMIYHLETITEFDLEVNHLTKEGWEPYNAQVVKDGVNGGEVRGGFLYVVFLRRKRKLN